ncbi:MAG: MltA domain-containing protein [Saprospiraceae bacterium]|nr:MltA domain-containing protein [Saprospiraceae bacterium]
MKKYWISFISSLLFSVSIVSYLRSIKESDQLDNIALDSLINGIETHKEVIKTAEPKKVLISNKDIKLRDIFTRININELKLPSVHDRFRQALEHQETFIKNAEEREVGSLNIYPKHLNKVLNAFRKVKSKNDIANLLDAYQLRGEDGDGNVLFTGYYSPIIPARRKSDAIFKYPVYLAQNGQDDDGMTLAYVRDRQDIRSMELEGVAYLQFPEGDRRVVAYNGDSKKVEEADGEGYASVFTQRDKSRAMGAAKVPLTTDFTVAVDPKYIPLGSVLLAEIPILDDNGNLIRTEMRFVLAQDRGSKIKGTGHVDLYMGEGDAAKERIKDMRKYGRIWLLLPKRDEKDAPKKTLAQKV